MRDIPSSRDGLRSATPSGFFRTASGNMIIAAIKTATAVIKKMNDSVPVHSAAGSRFLQFGGGGTTAGSRANQRLSA